MLSLTFRKLSREIDALLRVFENTRFALGLLFENLVDLSVNVTMPDGLTSRYISAEEMLDTTNEMKDIDKRVKNFTAIPIF